MLEIPPNATIRQEYKCGNPDCQNSHDPYLYAYWKQDRKLRKLYVLPSHFVNDKILDYIRLEYCKYIAK
jgi:hypothetical protein